MKIIIAVAVQLSQALYSREGAVEKVVQKIHELGRQQVQFAFDIGETPVSEFAEFPLRSNSAR